ncbi:MAG: phosphoenolpyruvate synthase [Nanoarchaeota archaeon]|nr:phosphoenolpyruvate synthase [Nanoarchaeota archaeon]
MTKEESGGFIKWFSELNKSSGNIAGGKGSNLAEIYNLKIPVPPGFVVTAQAYDYFLEKAGLKDKIKEILGRIAYEDTESLNKATEEIRKIIIDSEFEEDLKEEILEAYENLGADEEIEKTIPVNELIKKSSSEPFVAVRSSATAEDLAEASFAGQQESFLNVKGQTELLKKIRRCFASLFTSRATYYRNKKGFKDVKVSLAVVVQKMVDSNKSGVIFSKNPSTGEDNIIIEAVWGLGEGIVSGQITPDRYIVKRPGEKGDLEIQSKEIKKKKIAITRDSGGNQETVKLTDEISERQVLKEHEIKKLAEFAIKLEEHYQKPQDIEFAIENDEIFIVQTRPITTLGKELDKEGVFKMEELKGEIILKGLAASPGIASGKVRIIKDLKDLAKIKEGDVLVTGMTNPDMVVSMQKSAAIITDEGGMTAHASIVSREMGIPAVVGTEEATIKLKDGEIVTVNGFTGKIYKGKVSETVQKEVKPVEVQTKTKLKVILDLPSFATRAAKSNLKSVGLARVEGIIAESGKHPMYFLEKNIISEYEELIFKGISEIGEHFKEIWVRTSDIRSDEFGNLEGAPKIPEANPMLGMHGIRYSLKHPEILKAELNAMKRVSEKGVTIGILTPQIISVQEVQELKSVLKEIGFEKAKVGVMVETPASVQIIEQLCDEGIDFISFGTNDLTQYTLAIDRGNRQVQEIYDEMHPAILSQIKKVIEVCKEKKVETSICGQSGSKKPMVKFLVECGIDSISVNADVAKEISEYILELEKEEPVRENTLEPPEEKNENKILETEKKPEPVEEKVEEKAEEEIQETKGESEQPQETEKESEPVVENVEEKNEDEIPKAEEHEPTVENIEEKNEGEIPKEKEPEPSEEKIEEPKEVETEYIEEQPEEKFTIPHEEPKEELPEIKGADSNARSENENEEVLDIF